MLPTPCFSKCAIPFRQQGHWWPARSPWNAGEIMSLNPLIKPLTKPPPRTIHNLIILPFRLIGPKMLGLMQLMGLWLLLLSTHKVPKKQVKNKHHHMLILTDMASSSIKTACVHLKRRVGLGIGLGVRPLLLTKICRDGEKHCYSLKKEYLHEY